MGLGLEINKNEAEKGLDKKWLFDLLFKESLEERMVVGLSTLV